VGEAESGGGGVMGERRYPGLGSKAVPPSAADTAAATRR